MPLNINVFRKIRRNVRHVSISSLNGNVCVFFTAYYFSKYRAFYTGNIHKISPVFVSSFEMDTVKAIHYLWGN